MGKITEERQNGLVILSNRLSKNEDVNMRELDMLTRDSNSPFLPVSYAVEKNDKILRSTGATCVSFLEYASVPVNRKAFFRFLSQTADMLRACELQTFKIKNLEPDFRHVFVDRSSQNLKFIYWPIVNAETAVSIVDFLTALPSVVTFVKYEDNSYASEYIRFLRNGAPFSLNNFEQYVKNSYNGAAAPVQAQPPAQPPFRQQPVQPPQSYNPAPAPQAQPLFNQQPPAPQQQPYAQVPPQQPYAPAPQQQSYAQTPPPYTPAPPPYSPAPPQQGFYRPADPGDGETERFVSNDDDSMDRTAFLDITLLKNWDVYLLRSSTNEKIIINKPEFIIGSNIGLADYAVQDNKTISRKHATIHYEGGKFYITDNGSTNKSFIDGGVLPANQKVALVSDSKVSFSNEEFTFHAQPRK